MALFLIERQFAEVLNPNEEAVRSIGEVNSQVGVKWLYSFLSADKRKTWCLYEADNSEKIVEAARRAGLPADVVVELSGEIRPDAIAKP
jgi:hypothetical protein